MIYFFGFSENLFSKILPELKVIDVIKILFNFFVLYEAIY